MSVLCIAGTEDHRVAFNASHLGRLQIAQTDNASILKKYQFRGIIRFSTSHAIQAGKTQQVREMWFEEEEMVS